MKNFLALVFLVFLIKIVDAQQLSIPQWEWNEGNINNTNTSGNVGINTITPLEKLHINGNIRGGALGGALRIKTSGGYIDIGPQNTGWAHIYTDRSNFILNKPLYLIGASLSSYSTDNLNLQTNGTTRISILNANGNVGIGTTPSHRLDVNGNTQVRGNLYMYDKDVLNIRSLQLKDWDDNSGGVDNKYRILARDGAFQFYDGGMVVGNYANGTWSDLPNGNLIVEDKIGIGLIDPSEKLDVSGTLRIRGLTQDDTQNRLLVSDNNGKVFWRDASTLSSGSGIDGITSVNGNVGIGSPNPTTKLDVNGIIRGAELLEVHGGSPVYLSSDNIGGESGLIGSSDDIIAAYMDDGSYKFGSTGAWNDGITIRNGNVGIDNINPSSKLSVNGGFELLSNTSYPIKFGNDETEWDFAIKASDPQHGNIVQYNPQGEFSFANRAIHVNTYANPTVTINGELNSTGVINASAFTINGQPFSGGGVDGITSLNGNIGVNELNPQEELHVNGVIRAQTLNDEYHLTIGTTSSDEILGIKHSHSGRIIEADDGGYITIGNSSTHATRVFGRIQSSSIIDFSDANDNMTIGRFEDQMGVFNSFEQEIAAYELNGDYYRYGGGQIIVNNNANWTNISGELNIQGNIDASSFTINGQPLSAVIEGLVSLNGNILINKTTQTNTNYKLDVNGHMRANEIVVNTTGADFVFEDDYKLNTLEEVEAFIEENNHLPDIPSAAEMQENGMEVGSLNTKLLQKVEELTLYMIQLKKENEELRERVANLENK